MQRLSHPALASAPRLDELLGLLSIGAGTREIMVEMRLSRQCVANYVARIADRLEIPPAMRGRRVRTAIVRSAEREATRAEMLAALREAIEHLAAA